MAPRLIKTKSPVKDETAARVNVCRTIAWKGGSGHDEGEASSHFQPTAVCTDGSVEALGEEEPPSKRKETLAIQGLFF